MDRIRHALVTGAEGHLGHELVRALAGGGHRVRAVVGSDRDAARIRALMPEDAVEVACLDVRDLRAFEAAASGIDLLFQVDPGSRVSAQAAPREALIRDSLDAARAALTAAARAGVQKVVFISSIAALPLAKGGRMVTEADWCTDFRVPCFEACTRAEQLAWTLSRQWRLEMVALLPGLVLGPGFLHRTMGTDLVESIMRGAFRWGAPELNLPVVDVRDAVVACLLAARSEVDGRFAVCNDLHPTFYQVSRCMQRIDPSVPAPRRVLPAAMTRLVPAIESIHHHALGTPRVMGPALARALSGRAWTISNQRAREVLGWQQQVPLERSLADTMSSLRERGVGAPSQPGRLQAQP